MVTGPRTSARTIDEYLAALSARQRAALQKLRTTIRSVAPDAEECISYSLPAFRFDGRVLVCFGASTKHCSFFPGSGTTVAAHAELLKGYDTSKGTIRFPPEKPLPAGLVQTIVKARIAENSERAGKSASKGAVANKQARRPTRATVARAKATVSAKADRSEQSGGQTDAEVSAYIAKLKHPLGGELESLRRLILAVSPAIREGIKWNSPSFRTTEWFATINVHGGGRPPRPADPPTLRLILHRGAKVKDDSTRGMPIADPAGLLDWLATDRCLVTFGGGKELQDKRAALQAIVRGWIRGL